MVSEGRYFSDDYSRLSSFVLGAIMLILVATLMGVYGFALFDSNLDAVQALSLSLERIVSFFQMMVGAS
ncbi:MAG: hypothetical protein Q9P01_04375 [Anaerolineae bacterium]|nr:hypothetical protein [Anaerolineae bacterium]